MEFIASDEHNRKNYRFNQKYKLSNYSILLKNNRLLLNRVGFSWMQIVYIFDKKKRLSNNNNIYDNFFFAYMLVKIVIIL